MLQNIMRWWTGCSRNSDGRATARASVRGIAVDLKQPELATTKTSPVSEKNPIPERGKPCNL